MFFTFFFFFVILFSFLLVSLLVQKLTCQVSRCCDHNLVWAELRLLKRRREDPFQRRSPEAHRSRGGQKEPMTIEPSGQIRSQ
jgi:hypothetical protein